MQTELNNKYNVYQELFTTENWNSFYTKEEYQKKTERAQACTLHFLLALNQSEETIVKCVNNLNDRTKLIDKDYKCYQLTALHLAVMRKKEKVVQAILDKIPLDERQNRLNAQDQYGWTPLHHAVLTSSSIYQLLIKYGADLKAKTNLDATPEDLLVLTGRKIVNQTMSNVELDLPHCPHKKLSDLSPIQLKEFTGLTCYSDSNLFPPSQWKKLWQADKENEIEWFKEQTVKYWKKKFHQNEGKYPKLILGVAKQLKDQNISDFLELRAGQPILKGEIITSYTGEIIDKKPFPNSLKEGISITKRFSYELNDINNDINAEEVGNAARWANCGFPNVVCVKITDDKIKNQGILVAASDIKENQPIVWDFGQFFYHLSFGKQIPFNFEEMRSFFHEGLKSLKQKNAYFLNMVSSRKFNGEVAESIDAFFSRLQFPLNNPNALLDLHFRGIVKASEWLSVIKKNTFKLLGNLDGDEQTLVMIRMVIKQIIKFDESHQLQLDEKKMVSQWILNSIGKLELAQILKGMELSLLQKVKSDEFKRFIDNLTDQMKQYDWLNQKDNPLCTEKIAQSRLEELLDAHSPSEIYSSLLVSFQEMKDQHREHEEAFEIITKLMELLVKKVKKGS